MISQELRTMTAATDAHLIYTRYKAITALFPYVAWKAKKGQGEMFDTFLHIARTSKKGGFMWHRIRTPIAVLLREESPISLKQAILLASPNLPWRNPTTDGNFVRLWAEVACAVPWTCHIGQSVVDTLLLIASQDSLRSHIPVGMWSWLNKRPLLPPTCAGGCWGTERNVVQTVRKLGDVEILTSYLLHVWSDEDYLYPEGLDEMCASIREDFYGAGTRRHRKDLLQHLDRVLAQLDFKSESIQQQERGLGEDDIQSVKGQYERLKEVLLQMDVLFRESPRFAIIAHELTGVCRVSLNVHVWNPPPLPIVVRPEYLPLHPLPIYLLSLA